MEAIGYSIWLEPEGNLKGRLNKVIQTLAQENGTPVFEPHVTLIGGMEGSEADIKRNTESLALKMKPFSIELTGQIGCEETWQKAVFVCVRETDPVMEANRLARLEFNLPSGDIYKPHLTLMYSDSILMERRIAITRGLNRLDVTGQFDVSRIRLNRNGKVEEWVKLAEFPLQ